MATFPTTLLQHAESNLDPVNGTTYERMSSGKPNARNLFDADLYEGTIVIPTDDTGVDQVLSFWDTNKNLEFTFTFDGDSGLTEPPGTYTALFVGKPTFTRIANQYYVRMNIVAWE